MPQREYSESQLQTFAEQGESSRKPWSQGCSVTCCKLNAPKAQFSWVGSGLPSGLVAKNLLAKQETEVGSWVRKIPRRGKWQTIPVFLPWKSHGQRSLVGYCPWGLKESDTTERLHSLNTYLVMKSYSCPIFVDTHKEYLWNLSIYKMIYFIPEREETYIMQYVNCNIAFKYQIHN